jgi:hypothetical protein
MAVNVAAGISTPGANTTTADLVSGTYKTIGPGNLSLIAKASAAGIRFTLLCGGVPLGIRAVVTDTGSAGSISTNDNVQCAQYVKGGVVELYLENTTATAGTTCDYKVLFTPGK